MGKGEIACNKQFLLLSQCFLPYMVLIYNFKCTLKCCLQFFFNLYQSKILSSGNGLKHCSNITQHIKTYLFLKKDRTPLSRTAHTGLVPTKERCKQIYNIITCNLSTACIPRKINTLVNKMGL